MVCGSELVVAESAHAHFLARVYLLSRTPCVTAAPPVFYSGRIVIKLAELLTGVVSGFERSSFNDTVLFRLGVQQPLLLSLTVVAVELRLEQEHAARGDRRAFEHLVRRVKLARDFDLHALEYLVQRTKLAHAF